MPFTPTHVAAILPFSYWMRKPLPFSALAIGTMIPDLPMFVPRFMSWDYRLTHGPIGIFSLCLPMGITAFLWFQCFAKRPLVQLLPTTALRRLHPHDRPCLEASYWFFVRVAIAILIGAGTHVFWDSFTHHARWGTRLVPGMERIVFQWGGYSLEAYKALQHGSTVVFAPLMVVLAYRWLAARGEGTSVHSDLSRTQKVAWWAILLLAPNVLALVRCWWMRDSLISVGHFAREAVTTAGFLFFVTVNLFALYCYATTRRTSSTEVVGSIGL